MAKQSVTQKALGVRKVMSTARDKAEERIAKKIAEELSRMPRLIGERTADGRIKDTGPNGIPKVNTGVPRPRGSSGNAMTDARQARERDKAEEARRKAKKGK